MKAGIFRKALKRNLKLRFPLSKRTTEFLDRLDEFERKSARSKIWVGPRPPKIVS
jgi:hypothetical protein